MAFFASQLLDGLERGPLCSWERIDSAKIILLTIVAEKTCRGAINVGILERASGLLYCFSRYERH